MAASNLIISFPTLGNLFQGSNKKGPLNEKIHSKIIIIPPFIKTKLYITCLTHWGIMK